MVTREWEPGDKGKTSKGEFVVKNVTPQGYIVFYISGPWSGKHIRMPRTINHVTKTVEDLRLTGDEKETLLDKFFNRYSQEYNSVYYPLREVSGLDPTSQQMVNALRNEHPALVQEIIAELWE